MQSIKGLLRSKALRAVAEVAVPGVGRGGKIIK